MKPSCIPLVSKAIGLAISSAVCSLSQAAILTWDGGGSGTGTSLNTGTNWSGDALPVATDTARWNGSPGGNLALTMSGALGGGAGTAGLILDFTSSQTGNVSISGNTIRVSDISVAAGAGTISLPIIQIGGLSSTSSHAITNNSSHNVSQGSLLKGGGGTRNITITGSSDYTITGRIDPSTTTDSNGMNIIKSGSGTLFLDGDSATPTNKWNSLLTINSGAVRISNSFSLGLDGSAVAGTGHTSISGGASTARLELTGGISVAEIINLNGKDNATNDHFVNVGGNNTLSGALTLNTGGNIYNFRSDGGKLTISGDLALTGSAATKTINTAGSGNMDLTGVIGNGSGTIRVAKAGGGTLTFTNSNTYTGTTTISEGKFMANNTSGSATGSGIVSVSSGAGFGGTGSISGTLNVSGTLAPGASVETLGSGTLNLNDGSIFAYEVDSSAALSSGADLMKVNGNLNLAGTVALTFADVAITDTAFTVGTTLSLINYTGSWNGGLFTFGGDELENNDVFTTGVNMWRIVYDAAEGGGNFVDEHAAGPDHFVNIIAVPEPSALLLGPMVIVLLLTRRQREQQAGTRRMDRDPYPPATQNPSLHSPPFPIG